MKLPFDIIQDYTLQLAAAMAQASLLEDDQMVNYFYDQYQLYLEYSGWNDIEFNMELLNHIDTSWDRRLN